MSAPRPRALRAGSAVAVVVFGLVVSMRANGGDPQAPSGQPPTFRAGVDVVTVDASIQDGVRIVTGLQPSDFEVLDNGVPQSVATVSYGKLPIDVTVVLDVSGSVSGAPLARLQRGVHDLLTDVTGADRLKLVTCSHNLRRVLDFTSDHEQMQHALAGIAGAGGTSIFDALAVSMLSPVDPDRRRFVTLFTDGADNESVTEPRLLLEAGRRAQAAVTTVLPLAILRASGARTGLGFVPRAAPAEGQRPESVIAQRVRLLDQVAALTGGRLLGDPGPPNDLGTAFRSALESFRSSYVLYFTPRGVDRAGFHTLRVAIRGHANYTVRARSGYFGN